MFNLMGNPEDRFSRVMGQEAATVKIANSVAYIISCWCKRPLKNKQNTCIEDSW